MKKNFILSSAMLLAGFAFANAADSVTLGEDGTSTTSSLLQPSLASNATQLLYPAGVVLDLSQDLTINEITFYQTSTSSTFTNPVNVTISLATSDYESLVNMTSQAIQLVPAADFEQVYSGTWTPSTSEGETPVTFKLDKEYTIKAGKSLAINIVTTTDEASAATINFVAKVAPTIAHPLVPTMKINRMVTAYKNNATSVYESTPTTSYVYPKVTFAYNEGGETPEPENGFALDITNVTPERISATEGEISVTYNVTEETNVDYYTFFVVRAPREGESDDVELGSTEVKAGARSEITVPLTLDNDNEFTTYLKYKATYTDGTASEVRQYNGGAVYVPAYVLPTKFTAEITSATPDRVSATVGTVEIEYNVTEEENVEAYYFYVVRAPREGESGDVELGNTTVKAGAKAVPVEVEVALDSEDAIQLWAKLAPIYTNTPEGEYGPQASEMAVNMPAWIETPANSFAVNVISANAERVDETTATLDLLYNIEEVNANVYHFYVYNEEGTKVGESEDINVAGRDSSVEIALSGLTANAQKLTLKYIVEYKSGTPALAMGQYEEPIELAAYEPIHDGVNLVGAENSEAIYFNLQGARVANPENGLYIRVINGKAQKVVVK